MTFLFLISTFLFLNWISLITGANVTWQVHRNWKNLPSTCGVSFRDDLKTNYIIGGKPAKMGEFPWLGVLGYDYKDNTQNEIDYSVVLCSGSLIHPLYVVTAAHCTNREEPIGVQFGQHNVTNPNECIEERGICKNPASYPIARVVNHEKYNAASKINDLTLLILKSPVKYTELIRPICLPDADVFSRNIEGDTAVVAGWGYIDAKNKIQSKVPNYVEQEIWNLETCRQKYAKDNGIQINSRQLCVGGIDGKDSCCGDSGGPLMYRTFTGEVRKHYLLGVVSFGPEECAGGLAGVYVYVKHYLDWILNFVVENASDIEKKIGSKT